MQSRVKKPRTRIQRNTRTEVIDQETKASKRRGNAKAIEAELDEMLDEIDGVLEGLDQDLADKFVQWGGE